MTETPAGKPRESFVEAAQRELIAFEQKELELRRQAKRERAAQLNIPYVEKLSN